MHTKLVLFDFDGTIADTLPLSLRVVNEHAEELGFKKVTNAEVEKMKGMTVSEILAYVKVPFYRLPSLIRLFHKEIANVIVQAPTFDGMEEVLQELKESGMKLGIISSSNKENILSFLRHHKLDHYFDFVYSKFNLFGKHETIKDVLKKFSYKSREVIYVGDEVRDIEAARKASIDVIAVTWGFNTKELLMKANPTFIINSPKEVLKILKPVRQAQGHE